MKYLSLVVLTLSLVGCTVEDPNPEPESIPSVPGPGAPPIDYNAEPVYGPPTCANKYSNQGPFPVPVLCDPFVSYDTGDPPDYKSTLPEQKEMPMMSHINGT